MYREDTFLHVLPEMSEVTLLALCQAGLFTESHRYADGK